MNVLTAGSEEFRKTWPGFTSESRILVVGTAGAGKSTLARRLAAAYGLRDIELDALYWGPDWTPCGDGVFRTRVERSLTPAGGWAVHGNYRKVRDLTEKEADTLILLDYPRGVVMARVLKRTLNRVFTRKRLWSGNRETFRKAFLSRDSILVWAWTTHRRRHLEACRLVRSAPSRQGTLLLVRRPRETAAFFPPRKASG